MSLETPHCRFDGHLDSNIWTNAAAKSFHLYIDNQIFFDAYENGPRGSRQYLLLQMRDVLRGGCSPSYQGAH